MGEDSSLLYSLQSERSTYVTVKNIYIYIYIINFLGQTELSSTVIDINFHFRSGRFKFSTFNFCIQKIIIIWDFFFLFFF